MTEKKQIIIKSGDKYNMLTLLEEPYMDYSLGKRGKKVGLFKCECGVEKIIVVQNVKSQITKSCGCYNRKAASERMSKQSKKYERDINHPIYNSHKRMKNLCIYEKGELYEGLPYFEDWLNYDIFFEWCISNGWQEGLSLTTKEKEKGYFPENCYFTTSSEIIKNNINPAKTRKTMEERYGGWYTTTDEYLERKKTTCLEKYGVEHPQQSEDIKEKIKETCIERYGGENPMASQEVRDKIKKTNLERRGVEYVAQDPEVMKKIKETMIKNGTKHYYEDKGIGDLAEIAGVSRTCMGAWIRKYGFDEAITMTTGVSSIETKIRNLLDSFSINYEVNRSIGKYKPDIVIDNLIIECDGLYWHSDAINKDKYYHRNKMRFYKENGYKPIFFRENEIENKFDVVKSIILHQLNMSEKLYARKCEIKQVDKETAKIFFFQNHLMGQSKGEVIGLFSQGELVSCLQYTVRENLNIERFCHKKGLTVVGGLSKMLKYLPEHDIQTFVDLRYGSGEYLIDLGFTKKNEDVSFKWVKNNQVFHRLQFTGNTGYQEGCSKLWDCGQALYVKKLKEKNYAG